MSEKKCCVWYNYCMLNHVYVQFIGAFLLVLVVKKLQPNYHKLPKYTPPFSKMY